MAPHRAAHVRLKAEIWLALRDGIKSGGLPCEVFPDGMGVRIDEASLYEPDAVVHCGESLPGEEVLIPAPVIVVEVLSPSTPPRRYTPQARGLLSAAEPAPLPDRAG
jgi:Uma2 family endonuclease